MIDPPDRLSSARDFVIRRFNASPARTIRASSFRAKGAVTIIELLVVIMIILILAGLILSISSYVQNKGARARAETEIAAMSAALESYKADNGIYPSDNTATSYAYGFIKRSIHAWPGATRPRRYSYTNARCLLIHSTQRSRHESATDRK